MVMAWWHNIYRFPSTVKMPILECHVGVLTEIFGYRHKETMSLSPCSKGRGCCCCVCPDLGPVVDFYHIISQDVFIKDT